MSASEISRPPVVLYGPDQTVLELTGDTLRAGSSSFERVWRILPNGSLQPQSFQDRVSGVEWVSLESPPLDDKVVVPPVFLEAMPRHSVVEADSLIASLRVITPSQQICYRLQIFPMIRGVRITRSTDSSDYPSAAIAFAPSYLAMVRQKFIPAGSLRSSFRKLCASYL